MGDDERFDYVYRFVSRDTYRRGDQRQRPEAQPVAAQLRRPVGGPVHRRRPRGRRQRRDRRVAPADPQRPVGRARASRTEEVLVFTRLAADAVQPTKMDRPEDVAAQPRTTAGSTSRAPTTPTAASPTRKGPTEPNPRARQQGRARRRDRARPAATTRPAVVHLEPAADLRRPEHRRHLLRRVRRARLADLVPGQRGLRQRGLTCGSPPTGSPSSLALATRRPLQGAAPGPRARPGAAVPRRTHRRRDLRAGDPRRRRSRLGVLRRGAAPR